MNILYVIPYFNPKRGGDVNICSNIANHFVKTGHEVTILTTDFELDLDYLKSIKEKGVNVVYSKVLFNVGLFIYSPEMKKWLNENISNFDIIHLHTFRAYQNNIVRKYSKKFAVPYILQAHGSALPFFQKQTFKKIYDKVWGYKLLEDASKLIAGTEAESKQYIMMGVTKEQIEIIPNAVDFSQFEEIPKGFFRKKYSIGQSEKIILYLGRINRIKGIGLLLDSFKELSEQYTNFKLVLIGPDDGFLSKMRTQMNGIGSDKIVYIGPLYGDDKLEVYADADIYVLPSVYDSFPVTVLEALASGTPVIVTNSCGIVDIVKEVGRVVDYDPQSLNEAIIDLLTNDELRLTLGEKSRDLIRSKFTFEVIGKQFEDLYKKLQS